MLGHHSMEKKATRQKYGNMNFADDKKKKHHHANEGRLTEQATEQTNKHTLDTNRKRAFDGKTMLGGEEHSCGRLILHSHSFLVYSTNIHNSHAPSGTMNKRTNKSKCAFCVP